MKPNKCTACGKLTQLPSWKICLSCDPDSVKLRRKEARKAWRSHKKWEKIIEKDKALTPPPLPIDPLDVEWGNEYMGEYFIHEAPKAGRYGSFMDLMENGPSKRQLQMVASLLPPPKKPAFKVELSSELDILRTEI